MKKSDRISGVFAYVAVLAAVFLVACGSTVSAATYGSTAPPLPGARVYQAVWRSVLCVGESGECIGTAWVIEPGLAVTAQHVVGKRRTVNVYSAFAGPFPATVTTVDVGQDIAVLAFDKNLLNAPPVQTRSLDLLSELGETLYGIGYGGCEIKDSGGVGAPLIRNGIFSQMPNMGAPLGFNIKTQVPGVPGDSGGPLVDDRGNVVGMFRSKDMDGVYYYAVTVERIRDLLPRAKVTSAILR